MKAVWWIVLVASFLYMALALYGDYRHAGECAARGGVAVRSATLTGGSVCVKELR